MLPHTNDLSNYGFLSKIGIISGISCLGELICYPLDRLRLRCVAKQKYETSSFAHIKETLLIKNQIQKVQGQGGLYYGLKIGIDRAITMNLSRFLIYDFILAKWAKYIEPDKKSDTRNDLAISVSLLISQTIATLLTQPANILKIKIQCEPLDDKQKRNESYKQKQMNIVAFHDNKHSILIKPGIKSSLIFQNLLAFSEIYLFFGFYSIFYQEKVPQATKENEQIFTQVQIKDSFKKLFSCFSASLLATTILYPIEFLNHRYVLRGLQGFEKINFIEYSQVLIENEGLYSIFKGIAPSILRNTIQNSILMYLFHQAVHYHRSSQDLFYRLVDKVDHQQSYGRGSQGQA